MSGVVDKDALQRAVDMALKEAYRNGYHDGCRYGGSGRMSPKLWRDSVPFLRRVDTLSQIIAAAIRKGAKP